MFHAHFHQEEIWFQLLGDNVMCASYCFLDTMSETDQSQYCIAGSNKSQQWCTKYVSYLWPFRLNDRHSMFNFPVIETLRTDCSPTPHWLQGCRAGFSGAWLFYRKYYRISFLDRAWELPLLLRLLASVEKVLLEIKINHIVASMVHFVRTAYLSRMWPRWLREVQNWKSLLMTFCTCRAFMVFGRNGTSQVVVYWLSIMIGIRFDSIRAASDAEIAASLSRWNLASDVLRNVAATS